MVQDQTLAKGNEETQTPEEKTAEETETPVEETPEETTEPEVDYKVKFVESQKEALRLKKELDAKKAPEKKEPSSEKPDLSEVVRQEVQAQIAPLTAEQEKKTVDEWLVKNPDAANYLEQIDELLPKVPGKTTSEKLENSYLLAKKDAMQQAGKREMAFALHQKAQVAASGGATPSKPVEGLPVLTREEKEAARKLGVSEEDYAKNK